MKKLIICAAVAIAALASCTKTQVINTEDPQEIGFKVIAGKMTKAEQATGSFNQDLGVVAYYGNDLYFDDAQFTKDTEANPEDWKCATAKYWPVQSTLDFKVWSPYSGATEQTKVLTFSVNNSNTTAIAGQTDYLYGEVTSGRTTSAVTVELNHILAKLTIGFKKTGPDVTVKSVTLHTPTLTGTYVYNYTNGTGAWTANTLTPGANVALSEWTSAELEENSYEQVSFMVVPNRVTGFTFVYAIEGGLADLEATIDLTKDANGQTLNPVPAWDTGTHYIYNVDITPLEIKFIPEVEDWKDGKTSSINL